MKNIRIEVFNDFYDAVLFLETEMEFDYDYVKGEILRTSDGRWRVSLITDTETQMEFDLIG